MSKRLTRKQIKEDIRHDQFQDAMTSTFDSLLSHQKQIIGAGVAVVVLAVGSSVGYTMLRNRDTESADELAKAVKVYGAPIEESGAKPDDPTNPSFASAEDRLARSREALDEVSSGVAGDVARLYLAKIALGEGDRETAREHWESFLDGHSGHILAVQVRLNLLRLDREEGRGEEVVRELEEELRAETSELPEDILLFELAVTLDALGRGSEARDYYQRILDDHPTSRLSVKAREKTSST